MDNAQNSKAIRNITANSFFKEKYRIIAVGVFSKGIRPEWEDENNAYGKIFTMEYLVNVGSEDLNTFLNELKKGWTKLVLSILGEVYEHSEFVSNNNNCL